MVLVEPAHAASARLAANAAIALEGIVGKVLVLIPTQETINNLRQVANT
jgi:hypothetical protein